jgi:Fe-S-cluster containining protein
MADLDDLYAQVPDVGCKGLCVNSCGSVAMSPEEQRRIAERGVHLPLLAAFVDHCPALRNGRCSVYEVRPMVCRLWGAVEGMKCPFGCAPVFGYLSDATGQRLLGQVTVSSRAAQGGG